MKQRVASRPHSAPAAKETGVESPNTMAAKKKREMEQALRQRSMEYNQWLQNVSQAKFKLPFHQVVHPEEKKRRAEAVKAKIEENQANTDKYFMNVKKMEAKHHARIMRSLKVKLKADQLYNEHHAEAA